MNVGFTGTHHGMTDAQHRMLTDYFIVNYGPNDTFHGGDCIGADKQAHQIACVMGMRTVGHIPIKNHARAHCKYDEERAPLPYLVRDKNIVKEANIMYATPATKTEMLRSGTWATIRYTLKAKKHLIIIFPDGTIREENYARH